MTVTVAALAEALGAEAVGALDLTIRRPAAPGDAGPDDIVLAMDPRYRRGLEGCAARVALLWPGADWQAMGFAAAIFAARPRRDMATVTRLFDPGLTLAPGIHPLAAIDPEAVIGAHAAIGPFVAIGPGARIGAGARIFSHVSIGEGVEIGAGALLHSGVRLLHGVRIGDRFIAQANAVIGSDGFSFVTPERGAVEEARESGQVSAASRTQGYLRIQSIGSVRIGDDVEVGAGTCIDRGTVADTSIGDGTKIDNLVQIGHNVKVGRTCLLCGMVGLAGSVEVGDRVVLGGRVAVADHIRIGSDVVVAGGALVGANIPPRSVMMGIPAQRKDKAVEALVLTRRLPELFRTVADLQKQVSKPGPTR